MAEKPRIKHKLSNKKGIEMQTLVLWIVAVAILIIVIMGYVILTRKDISVIEFVKNLFRFGR